MVEYSPMQNKRALYIITTLIVCLLSAAALIRYEVITGRSHTEIKLVSDFSSCLDAGGGLDITGAVCTTTTGEAYLKPGAVIATTTPDDASEPTGTSTIATTTGTTSLTLGAATTFALRTTGTISDGTTVTLQAIHDSRCKPDVQCIWAGELATDWIITTKSGNQTITLGTTRTNTLTAGMYTYTLVDATPDQAILKVTKTLAAPDTGAVMGTVTIGPICPVERIDSPCVVPPETYTSRVVVVYAADTVTVLKQYPLDATGHFAFTLNAGTYGLQIKPAGIGAGEIKTVTIAARATSTVNFTIDTGIR
jgi:hypothetical protein